MKGVKKGKTLVTGGGAINKHRRVAISRSGDTPFLSDDVGFSYSLATVILFSKNIMFKNSSRVDFVRYGSY